MSKSLTRIGIAITVIYLTAAVLLGWGEWDKFSELRPNEVGDFLAGVVGPLALLWLILGYFQQGEELRLSTEALRQQAEELKQSVLHQQELVEVTRQQVNAQLESFAQDRKKDRNLLRSAFELTPSGGSSTGGITRAKFRLQNFGHRATDILIEYVLGEDVHTLRPIPSLPSGGEVGITIGDLSNDVVGPIRLYLEHVDGAGEKIVLLFTGHVYDSGNIINVSLGKPVEVERSA